MQSWKSLDNNTEIAAFLREHAKSDVAALGLKKPPDPAWAWPLVLAQLKSRQKAALKIPSWLVNGVIFPAPDVIEQASSDATAKYKASLVEGDFFADLTAGAGVDFLALLKKFKKGIAIEQDKETAEILKHNLKILGAGSFEVKNAKAENIPGDLLSCDLVYLDPQRRSEIKKGLFRLQDCSPDILQLLPALSKKTRAIMVKTSPVLDIDQAVRELEYVTDVHIVEWQGDCREAVYLLNPHKKNAEVVIHAVVLDDEGRPETKFSFTKKQEAESKVTFSLPEKYLFEPSPAFQKAGCFKSIAEHYQVKKLHPHTHLYTSNEPRPGFPGRSFEILGSYAPDAKALPVAKANLTLRNFPGETEDLRKKLKLKDGGDDFLFACTLENGRKALLHTRKCSKC